MNNDNFVPAGDSGVFAKHRDAIVLLATDLIGALAGAMQADKQEALLGLLRADGRVGLEITADVRGSVRLLFVGEELDGSRLVLGAVPTASPRSGKAH